MPCQRVGREPGDAVADDFRSTVEREGDDRLADGTGLRSTRAMPSRNDVAQRHHRLNPVRHLFRGTRPARPYDQDALAFAFARTPVGTVLATSRNLVLGSCLATSTPAARKMLVSLQWKERANCRRRERRAIPARRWRRRREHPSTFRNLSNSIPLNIVMCCRADQCPD